MLLHLLPSGTKAARCRLRLLLPIRPKLRALAKLCSLMWINEKTRESDLEASERPAPHDSRFRAG